MLSFLFPTIGKSILFLLILMIFIGPSNAYSINNVTTPLNFNSKSSHFMSVGTKDKVTVSPKEQTSKAPIKTDSESKSNDKDKSTPFNPFNQDIIIPHNALLINNHFDKKELQIPLGATVNWKNHDNIDHKIEVFHRPSLSFSADPIGSKNLEPSDTLSVKFNHPGKYIFQCSSPNHNFMKGSILVK